MISLISSVHKLENWSAGGHRLSHRRVAAMEILSDNYTNWLGEPIKEYTPKLSASFYTKSYMYVCVCVCIIFPFFFNNIFKTSTKSFISGI